MPVRLTIYKCKHCGSRFILMCDESFDDIEEPLWAHIQMCHEGVFEEIQDLETPDMIGTAYTIGIYDLVQNYISE